MKTQIEKSNHYCQLWLNKESVPIVLYSHWDEGQPDNWFTAYGDEDCGQIHNSAHRIRKLLNDGNCLSNFGYICEARA